MPAATRVNDYNTGHDLCAAVSLETGSSNVRINGLPAGRFSDTYAFHSCDTHLPHADAIIEGSANVFINGLAAARVGDAVSGGAIVAEGSSNVQVGG